MQTNKNNLAKNASYLVIVQIANLALPFISIPIVSRIAGVENFGLINYSIAFVNYFVLLIDYSFSLSATRLAVKYIDDKKQLNILYSNVLSTKIFLFLISLVLFIGTLYFLDINIKTKYLFCFTYLFTVSTVLNNNWIYQAFQSLSKVAVFSFINKFLFTGLILFFIRQKEDYIYYSIIYSLTAIITSIISFIYARNTYSLRLKIVSFYSIWLTLKNDFIIFFSTIVISLYTVTNIIILGITSTPNEVGLYSSAEKITNLVSTVLGISFSQALYPYIAQSFNVNLNLGIEKVQKILPIIIYIVLCCTIVLFFFSSMIVNVIYGNDYLPASYLIKWMVLIPLLVIISNMFGIQLMLNLKFDKYFLYITSLGAIFGLLTNYFLSIKYAAIGTSISWLLTEAIITILMYVFLRYKGINPINLNYYKPSFIKSQIIDITQSILKKIKI